MQHAQVLRHTRSERREKHAPSQVEQDPHLIEPTQVIRVVHRPETHALPIPPHQLRQNRQIQLQADQIRRGTPRLLIQHHEQAPQQRVVRDKQVNLEPMTREEAVDQMELLGHDFFVYLDKETRKTNVVYIRDDGDYAVIETTTK